MNAIDTAIRSTLCGGTALTTLLAGTASVYHIRAPDNAELPYVLYSMHGGGAENINPSDLQNYLYYVRGYAGNGDAAASIAGAIKTLLDKKTLAVSGFTNFWTRFETEVESSEETSNLSPIYSCGGLYRIRIDS
jgi:hypothetical protein